MTKKKRAKSKPRTQAHDHFNRLFYEALTIIMIQRDVDPRDIEKFIDEHEKGVRNTLHGLSDYVYKKLKRDSTKILVDLDEGHQSFERAHRRLWGKSLVQLRTLHGLCRDLGGDANDRLRHETRNDPEKRLWVEAITRLHARSIYVGAEIITLLMHGYPDGAYARWRTLHEVSVVLSLIAKNDSDTAVRYLDHTAIESYRVMRDIEIYGQKTLDYYYSPEHAAGLVAQRDALCEKYGASYGTQYGWAAKVLNNPKPTLLDIEKAVNLENMRPSYRFASQSVHANPTGLSNQLGDSRTGPLVAGPSNWGLVDPAISTAMSLMIATLPLVETRAPVDNIVYTQVFLKFVGDIKKSFFGVRQGMEDREAARQRRQRRPSSHRAGSH